MQGKFWERFAEAFIAEAHEVGLVVQRYDSVTLLNLAWNSPPSPSIAAGHIPHRTVSHTNRAAPTRNTNVSPTCSAPGVSASRASGRSFIRAAQENAHNPLLPRSDSAVSGEFAGPVDNPPCTDARGQGGRSRCTGPSFPAAGHVSFSTSGTPHAAPKRNASDRSSIFAPGGSTSRAARTFIRASQANAHNPFISRTDSLAGEFAGPSVCVPSQR